MVTKAVFTTPPVSGAAASTASIGPLTVQRQDASGKPVPAPAGGTVVALSSTSSTRVFSATPGGASVTTLTIPAGASSITFYYGDSTAGTPTITAAITGLTSATQTATMTAGTASLVVFTTAPVTGTVSTTATTGPLTVERRDIFGNPVTSAAPVALTLSSNSTGTTVFSPSRAGSPVSTITIPAGASAATFYYGDTRSGTATVTVAGAGLTSAAQAVSVASTTATRLAYTTHITPRAASAAATADPITVQRQDATGNPVPAPTGGTTITLSSTSTGTRVFSTASGGASITTVTIPAGSSSATFYYGDTRAGTPTLTATSTGVSAISQSVTITPAAATRLVFGQQPTNTTRGSVITPAITASILDQYGNQTTSTAAVTISKTSTQGPDLGGTITVNAINGVATFSNLTVRGPARSYTLILTGTGLTTSDPSTPFNVN
ncbi:hypothetical protein ACX80L_15540 [Arthrobacter sp. MDT1-48-3]